MQVVIKKCPKTETNEAFIDGLLVGVYEQITPCSDVFSFMSKCSHEKLSGDHYIAICQKLNELNSEL